MENFLAPRKWRNDSRTQFLDPHPKALLLVLTSLCLCGMCSFLLKHKNLAVPALHICLEAFKWTDSEAMTKICSFCGVIVVLAISTNNAELRELVSKDLFYAAIQGLALESNAFVSSDLVSLCREIFVYLADRDPTPRQVS